MLFSRGGAAGAAPIDGAAFYESGALGDTFGAEIFEQVFSTPIDREGTVFRLECVYIADDRESMLVYTQDGSRRAVIITLPFLTRVQSRLFSEMVERGVPVDPGGNEPGRTVNEGRQENE